MTKSYIRFLSAALILVAFCAPAKAQTPQSLDQYPSFVEFTSQAKDGTQTVLRCGYYSVDSHTVTMDPGYQEITTVNSSKGIYSRLQRIDETVILTTNAPTGSWGLLLQVVTPDGAIAAKNCQTDTVNDTIQNCKPIQPMARADEVMTNDRKLGLQCTTLLNESVTQINPALADDEKTKAFKDTLRQKVQILLAK